MTKITFEEWKKNYKDIPFIEENFKELENHGIDVGFMKERMEYVIYPKIKYVRVFLYGGYYEIDEEGMYYLILGNEDWCEKTTDVIDKELYEWCNGEIFNTNQKK